MNLRDYGLGTAGATPSGRPKAKRVEDPAFQAALRESGGCPNCGCEDVMEIEVPMKAALLRGGGGIGKYLGCPACPWASPMIVVATGDDKI